ncbi:MAG: single-stranded DNA-binding protein [Clostridiales bacterium]|nr:single-stranded DNA-binding protein [Clostridiales bacterium]
MNRVILMGRLTADPELRQTPQGTSVTSFTIAVDRRIKTENGQQADFITCVAWRKTAEFICRYFQKGRMIAIEGQLQSRSWDTQDGKRQYATEVIVDNVSFTGEKPQTENTDGLQTENTDGFTYLPDDDTPF